MHKSKKLTKRILSGATAFSIAAATMLGQLAVTSAASENHVYSTAQSAAAGEEAHIPIFIENNTGFVSFNIYISYDPDVVTPVSVSTEDSVLTSSGDVNDSIGGTLRGLPENTVQVTFTSSDYTDATADGILFDFVCDVSEDATGSTTLGVSYDPDPDITFNADDEAVVFDCTDVELGIINDSLDSLPSVALSAESGKAGESLTISSAYTKKPDSFGDIHIELGYDKWSFSQPEVSVGEGKLSGVSDEDGRLVFDIIGADGNASAPFTVVFKVSADASEGKYTFKGTGSVGASQLNITGCKADISSDVKTVSPVISGPDGLSAKKGETLTVPVSIGRNSGLMGFIIEFSFDDTALEIVGAESSKLLAGSMNNNIGVEKGTFIVRWSNTENTTDEGVFLNVTFNVIGESTADTVIGIGYSAEDTFDESYNDVALICRDITVSLNQSDETTTAATSASTTAETTSSETTTASAAPESSTSSAQTSASTETSSVTSLTEMLTTTQSSTSVTASTASTSVTSATEASTAASTVITSASTSASTTVPETSASAPTTSSESASTATEAATTETTITETAATETATTAATTVTTTASTASVTTSAETTTAALVSVSISKLGDDGVQLAGAKLSLSGVKPDGRTAVEFAKEQINVGSDGTLVNGVGSSLVWICGSDAAIILAEDGTYTLHEEAAPTGYLVADDIVFVVSGGKVTVNGADAESVDMVDVKETTAATAESATTSATTAATTSTASATTEQQTETTAASASASTTASETTTVSTEAATTVSETVTTTASAESSTTASSTTETTASVSASAATTQTETTAAATASTTASETAASADTTETTSASTEAATVSTETSTTESASTTAASSESTSASTETTSSSATQTTASTTSDGSTATTVTTEQGDDDLGDVNEDGKVDAKDASCILVAYARMSTGGSDGFTERQRRAANVNGDDKVDAKDASAILAFYAYLQTGGSGTMKAYMAK